MIEPLTRETRYEGIWRLSESARWVPGDGTPHGPFAAPVFVTRCLSCGSMVAIGSEAQHEYMHPLASCNAVHPGCQINCEGWHPWEEQFAN